MLTAAVHEEGKKKEDKTTYNNVSLKNYKMTC